MTEAALIISAIIGAGVSTAQGVKSEQNRQAADNEAGRQADKQAQAEKDVRSKMADEEATQAANAMRDAMKQQMKNRSKLGREGTILTSPLGQSASATPGKTLLGS